MVLDQMSIGLRIPSRLGLAYLGYCVPGQGSIPFISIMFFTSLLIQGTLCSDSPLDSRKSQWYAIFQTKVLLSMDMEGAKFPAFSKPQQHQRDRVCRGLGGILSGISAIYSSLLILSGVGEEVRSRG